MEAKLQSFSQDSFDRDDEYFRSVTSLIQLIDKTNSAPSAAGSAPKDPDNDSLRYITITSVVLARHHEVVAAVPKYSGNGLTVFLSPTPESDTSADEDGIAHGLQVIMCENETLEPKSLDSSMIPAYICRNWYVESFLAIFR
jgi:hypothetical protein